MEHKEVFPAEQEKKAQTVFMCSPDYYSSIEYEINPWMKIGTQCANSFAMERWAELKDLLSNRLGVNVLTMQPQEGLPDIIFTANAALIYKNRALISSFRFKERQPEEKFYAEWLKSNGFLTEFLPEGICFEGAGDALFSGETLFAGYVPRSDIEAHHYISKSFGIKVVSLKLIDLRFYHLDTCFCPLTDGYVMYFPDAFDEESNAAIEGNVPEEKRIVVIEEEALKFSCNAVCIDNSIVMNHTTDRLKAKLKEKGFDTYEIDFTEFMKAGGSAKCLTLRLM